MGGGICLTRTQTCAVLQQSSNWVEIVILLVYATIPVTPQDQDGSDEDDAGFYRDNDTVHDGPSEEIGEDEEDLVFTTTEEVVVEEVNDYQYLPSILSVAIVLLFCISARLSYSFDFRYKKWGSIITLENAGEHRGVHSHVYLVMVDTGNWGWCGTTNRVRIEFHAKSFCSRVLCLKPNKICTTILMRGHRDIFVLKTGDCLGEVLSLTLLLVNYGKSTNWFLESIKLIDVSHSQEWTFPCYRWLSTTNKLSMVAKLFPAVREPRYILHRFQNACVELHTWASLVHNYNRLGRLTRLERLVLVCNMMMMQLCAYVLTMSSPYTYPVPEQDDINYSSNVTKAISLCIFVAIIVCLIALIPEYILRNAEPWSWKFYNLEQMISEISCLGCNPVGLPFKGDMALSDEDNLCLSPWHNTLQCEICMKKKENEELKHKGDKLTAAESKFLKPFVGEAEEPKALPDAKEELKKRQNAQTKMHELAGTYIDFFSRWNSFCHRFTQLAEDLQEYLVSDSSEGESMKLRRTMSWVLDAMTDIQLQHHFRKRQQESTPRSRSPGPINIDKPVCRLPDELLLPVVGFCQPRPRALGTNSAGPDNKIFLWLARAFSTILLIITFDNIRYFKNVCINTYTHLDSELVVIFQRIVCTMLHALEAFAVNQEKLCKISDGAITLYLDNADDFLSDYLQNNMIFDYDFPECASIMCHSLKTIKSVLPFGKAPEQGTQTTKKAEDEQEDGKKKKTEEELINIKTRIRNFTQLMVNDIVKNLVLVLDARRPLQTLYDFVQYKKMSDPSVDWSEVCVEYVTPLLSSVSCPLIKHALDYVGIRPSAAMFRKTDNFLETLVTNAAIQASCELGSRKLSCEEWLEQLSASKCNAAAMEDDPHAQNGLLIRILKQCLVSNSIPTANSSFCSDGKMHLMDKGLLQMLLEDERIRPAQLASPDMLKLLVSVVDGLTPTTKSIQQFIAHALVTLTEAQEDAVGCKPNSFMSSLRQQLLDLGFLIQRLVQKSEHLTACKDLTTARNTTEPPAYWSMPGYHHLQFLTKIAEYKGKLLTPDEVPPLNRQEQTNIQGIAFSIHKMRFSQRVTVGVYVYISVQTICILPAILYMTESWKTRMSIVAGIMLAVAVCIDFLIVQPLKVVIVIMAQERIARRKLKKQQPKKKKADEKEIKPEQAKLF